MFDPINALIRIIMFKKGINEAEIEAIWFRQRQYNLQLDGSTTGKSPSSRAIHYSDVLQLASISMFA
jgi:hypothetical protein